MLPSLLPISAKLPERGSRAVVASSPLTHSSPKRIPFLPLCPPLLPQTTLAQVSKDLHLVFGEPGDRSRSSLWTSMPHMTLLAIYFLPVSLLLWVFPSCAQSLNVFSHTMVGYSLPALRLTAFQPFQAIHSSLSNPIVLIPHVH